ncbi:MAG: retroviral-like aspartic protease family protein [Spirochaetaceae bacterium]|jgi:clan AA aspartic protease|nr:retroviral-like aspartic protease family protein [Spirochaetaceae bacterium]
MGTVYAELTLRNSEDITLVNQGFLKPENIRTVTVTAIVDTGSYSLIIDDQTMQKLGLEKTGEKRIRIANGERIVCPVTTPVEINWKDRQSVMRVISVPGLPQTLLGLLPLEEMDLIVNPNKHELVGAHGDEIEYMAY